MENKYDIMYTMSIDYILIYRVRYYMLFQFTFL